MGRLAVVMLWLAAAPPARAWETLEPGLEVQDYVEGGPEAQLYVRAGAKELEQVGSYETGFNENDDNREAWPIPNVVLVTRRR